MSEQNTRSPYQLDEVDRRIVYELMVDARNNSAPTIAEAVGVSPGTVRNHVEALESEGVIKGYHANVDFERTDGRLAALFMCSVPFAERKTIARAAYEIPGVVNVRILMGGRRNFHVLVVGEDTDDLRRIGTTLSELGVEIDDEMLLENEEMRAYAPFGSESDPKRKIPTDFIALSGDSEVVEVTVQPEAAVADRTISEAVETDHLPEDSLVVSVRRGDELLTPHGDTTIRPDDVVTVFAAGGVDDETVRAFTATEVPR